MFSSLRSREGACVAVLAALAAARVFAFAGAFPFFTNVDEHRHVDGVLKYARGYAPRPDNTGYEPEMARYMGMFGSPEYHLREGAGEAPPPTWKRSSEAMLSRLERSENFLSRRTNLEAMQPPAYYATAALWLRVGRAVGLQGGSLLYWVRGLSIPLVFALVWLAYRYLREIYPDDALMRLGVPLLLAAFPMDVFFYITRDALSPLIAGLGFWLALRLVATPLSSATAGLGIAVVMGVAFLAKYTNAALLVVCGLCTLLAVIRRPEARRLRGEMWALIAIPVGAWLVRNRLVFGDITATTYKIQRMGWGRAEWSEYFDHPIFTFAGLETFVSELVPLFWRGELVWHRVPLAVPGADLFYTLTTLVFFVLAVVGLRRRDRTDDRRFTEGMAALLVGGYVAILALLSPLYVFHETSNPSAALPYFVQGRLISGALVPFALIYVRGAQVAAGALPARFASPAAWALLGLAVAVAIVSEASLHGPVFASAYNLFHLP